MIDNSSVDNSSDPDVELRRPKGKGLRWVGLVLAILVLTAQCHVMYVSPSFGGHVFDELTMEPVEGAVVVAAWNTTGLEGAVVGSIAIVETKTSQNGSFAIESWGPRLNRTFPWALQHSAPRIFIVKRGYKPHIAPTYSRTQFGSAILGYGKLDGQQFMLQTEASNKADRSRDEGEVTMRFLHLMRTSCEWLRIESLIFELYSPSPQASAEEAQSKARALDRLRGAPCTDSSSRVNEEESGR